MKRMKQMVIPDIRLADLTVGVGKQGCRDGADKAQPDSCLPQP